MIRTAVQVCVLVPLVTALCDAQPRQFGSLREALDAYREALQNVPPPEARSVFEQTWLQTIQRHLDADVNPGDPDVQEGLQVAFSLSNSLGTFDQSLAFADQLIDSASDVHEKAYWFVQQAEIAAMTGYLDGSWDRVDRAISFVSAHPDVLDATTLGPSGILVPYVSTLAWKGKGLAQHGDISEALATFELAQRVLGEHAEDGGAEAVASLGFDAEYFAGPMLRWAADLMEAERSLALFAILQSQQSLRMPEGEYALDVYRALGGDASAESLAFLQNWFDQKGRSDPMRAIVAHTLGVRYLLSADYSKGISTLHAAGRDVDDPESIAMNLVLLASLYENSGDHLSAVQWWEEARSRYPTTSGGRIAAETLTQRESRAATTPTEVSPPDTPPKTLSNTVANATPVEGKGRWLLAGLLAGVMAIGGVLTARVVLGKKKSASVR